MEASKAMSDWRESDFSDSVTSSISIPIRSMKVWTGLPFVSSISACMAGISRRRVSNIVKSCNETMDCTNVESVTTPNMG